MALGFTSHGLWGNLSIRANRRATDSRAQQPILEQGNIYVKKKQYHEAIEQYQQALRLDPDAAIIHAALGWAYYNVGRLDAAIAAGEEVMRLEPDNPDVPKLMELLYQERNRRR